MAPDASNNSYTLELGGKSFVVGDVTIPASQWVWVDYAAGNISAKIDFALTSGSVPFKLVGASGVSSSTGSSSPPGLRQSAGLSGSGSMCPEALT
jgi:hypothetical protein